MASNYKNFQFLTLGKTVEILQVSKRTARRIFTSMQIPRIEFGSKWSREFKIIFFDQNENLVSDRVRSNWNPSSTFVLECSFDHATKSSSESSHGAAGL